MIKSLFKKLFTKKKVLHYGILLESILKELQTFEKELNNNFYIGIKIDLENVRFLISQLEELLDLLESEEKTSHLRSDLYLQKQKEFFLNLNDKIPTIYI